MSFPSQNTPKSVSAGVSPQTPLGELTALPRLPSWFQGAASRQEGNTEEGRTRGGERREGRGKGGSWGNSVLVVGDRRPCIKHVKPAATNRFLPRLSVDVYV